MKNDLKGKTFSNFVWRFAERCGAQLVAFIVSIVLARILDPESYGTVALITVFTSILQTFVDSGLGNALIQKKNADDIDFSTVFFTNILFCTVLYALVFAGAPFLADFYGDVAISGYTRVLGITVLISGVKNVQQAYVARHMMFRKFFFSTLGGTVTAGIIGVIMAYNGFGVWALVAQQVINLSIDTIILWITVKWRPHKCFSLERLRGLFSFGWKLLVSSLIDKVYTEIRSLIIGKLYSSSDLAYYNKGLQFPQVISNNISTSIDSVLLPAMSNEQEDVTRVKNMTRRSIKVSTYIMAPMMIGMAFIAKPLVSLILTDKWLPCVFFMQVFCVTHVFQPIHTANLNAIKALGRSDMFLKFEIIKKIVGCIALFSTIWISVKALAISLLVASFLNQLINSWPNKKLLNYGYGQQILDILPAIGLSVAMGLLIYPIQLLNLSNAVTLCIQIPMGVLIYIIGSKVFRIDSFEYILGIVVQFLKSKTKNKNRKDEQL